jgi:3-isopropylmalate/(R)-2-methylmalate dehydratase large subunit
MLEKIWDSHVVHEEPGQPSVLYVDLHLVHEVTSAQAFDGLRMARRGVRRPDLTVATADHNTPTWDRSLPITDPISKQQLDALSRNCEEFGVSLYDMYSENQGIVHIIGPEQGYTQPGKIIVCGDSHTSTHGAFGAFAMGIGTTQVELVLATQCIVQAKSESMEIRVNGTLPAGVTAKDLVLGVIGKIGIGGAGGHSVEYTGEAVRSLSMEGRMTVCNMSIEAGARAGMIAPDDITFDYMRGRPNVPQGDEFEAAVEEWRKLPTEPGSKFDSLIEIEARDLSPFVTWGTNPGMVVPITDRVPDPASLLDAGDREAATRALEYMDLEPNTPMEEITIDKVFIGSCTNARIEDLRAAAGVIRGRKVKDTVHAMVVPGSYAIKKQAESEGIAGIFEEAGFDWREAGCSMCLGMNPDILQPGERCASTSNRNFEGRQGKGGRTHLVSPQMAAAAAIAGHFVDIRDW